MDQRKIWEGLMWLPVDVQRIVAEYTSLYVASQLGAVNRLWRQMVALQLSRRRVQAGEINRISNLGHSETWGVMKYLDPHAHNTAIIRVIMTRYTRNNLCTMLGFSMGQLQQRSTESLAHEYSLQPRFEALVARDHTTQKQLMKILLYHTRCYHTIISLYPEVRQVGVPRAEVSDYTSEGSDELAAFLDED